MVKKEKESKTYDALPGDTKYHNSCWRDVMDHRTLEIQVPTTPHSHCSEVQGTHECTMVPDEGVVILDISNSDKKLLELGQKVELQNGQTILLRS